MNKKYELTNEILKHRGKVLFRIRALKDIYRHGEIIVKKGELGGYVGSGYNLGDTGGCWVFDTSMVYGAAKVSDNAIILKGSILGNNARACDNAVFRGALALYKAFISGSSVVNKGCLITGVVHDMYVPERTWISKDGYEYRYREFIPLSWWEMA